MSISELVQKLEIIENTVSGGIIPLEEIMLYVPGSMQSDAKQLHLKIKRYPNKSMGKFVDPAEAKIRSNITLIYLLAATELYDDKSAALKHIVSAPDNSRIFGMLNSKEFYYQQKAAYQIRDAGNNDHSAHLMAYAIDG